MKIKEITETLDWRHHSTKDYNHQDLLNDIEGEIYQDNVASEKAKTKSKPKKKKRKKENHPTPVSPI